MQFHASSGRDPHEVGTQQQGARVERRVRAIGAVSAAVGHKESVTMYDGINNTTHLCRRCSSTTCCSIGMRQCRLEQAAANDGAIGQR